MKGVKRKVLKVKLVHNETKLARIRNEQTIAFKKLIPLIENNQPLAFVDECLYTTNQCVR